MESPKSRDTATLSVGKMGKRVVRLCDVRFASESAH
jgi:hypothetical protein